MELCNSTVDTSRPFSSVKEAVAMFGERFLAGEIYSSRPLASPRQVPPLKLSPTSPKTTRGGAETTVMDTLKKLQSELEETKTELKVLKERESETEVALASLNAELHKSMSKMAQAEAKAASDAAAAMWVGGSGGGGGGRREGERVWKDMAASPSLAQILSAGEREAGFGGKKKEKKKSKKKTMMVKRKEKPIIPLVGDLFAWKKSSSTTLHNPLYSLY